MFLDNGRSGQLFLKIDISAKGSPAQQHSPTASQLTNEFWVVTTNCKYFTYFDVSPVGGNLVDR